MVLLLRAKFLVSRGVLPHFVQVKRNGKMGQPRSLVDLAMSPMSAKQVQELNDKKRKDMNLSGTRTFDDKNIEG